MAGYEIRMDNDNELSTRNDKLFSDEVIIEVVHALKDIIIEFINKQYAQNN